MSPNLSAGLLLPPQAGGTRWHYMRPEPPGYGLQGGNAANALVWKMRTWMACSFRARKSVRQRADYS